jgi:hypothetical protein
MDTTKKVFAGRTTPGATDWQQYTTSPFASATVHVDTSAAQFSSIPVYVISIGGDHNMFLTTGGCGVYNATPTGFDVYLKFSDGSSLVAANINSYNKWHVNWIGMEI